MHHFEEQSIVNYPVEAVIIGYSFGLDTADKGWIGMGSLSSLD